MRRSRFYRVLSTCLLALLACPLFFLPVSAKNVENADRLVVVGDVSQSFTAIDGKIDGTEYLNNAVKLAIDLAPTSLDVSLLLVDTEVRYETDFLDLSVYSSREEIKNQIDAYSYDGGTNLVVGIEKGVEKLDKGPGRIVMLADISDNALTRADNFDEMTVRAHKAAEAAVEANILVDLILLGEPDESIALVEAYTSIPRQTGGSLVCVKSPEEFAPAVETLYFENYEYNIYPITGVNSTNKEQEIDITLPTGGIARSRIYASAGTPIRGIRATYATAELGAEINESYAMIDLNYPSQDGISLFVDMGESHTTKIYVIADYNMETVVSVENELIQDKENENSQKAVLHLELKDAATGKPILGANDLEQFIPNVVMTSPTGKTESLSLVVDKERSYGFTTDYYPAEFGEYTISGDLYNGDFRFPISGQVFEISELTQEKSWILPTLLSVIISIFLIVGALLFYIYKKKKRQEETSGAIELDKSYEFTGQLHFAAILVEGGKREVHPFSVYLDRVGGRKRISLREIYAANSQVGNFPGMDKIWITPGPRNSIIIKNNSQAVLISAGKEYGYREKIQLFYNDKVFFIFNKDEDEIELYYKQTKPVYSKVTGNSVSVSLS